MPWVTGSWIVTWSSWRAGRGPNTLRAVEFDLKAFFSVVTTDPAEVTAADVFEFLARQRGDRSVVRLADRESGLSARTIARRLSSVSGLYAYLVARGDTPVRANPVPRGLSTRRCRRHAGPGWSALGRSAWWCADRRGSGLLPVAQLDPGPSAAVMKACLSACG